jgi:hypothetical protein
VDNLNGKGASVDVVVGLLEIKGPNLPFPYSSGIQGSRHAHMRELWIQHKGEPYRVLYAFDPRRTAILLLGGNKAGEDRWYEDSVPRADKLYDEHLEELKKRDCYENQVLWASTREDVIGASGSE